MGILRIKKIKALGVGVLIIALLVTGCAGMEPYEPRNIREEGPQKGLFTGAEGEFVFFRKVEVSKTGRDADENTDGEKQKPGNEKKAEDFTNVDQ